MNVPKFFLALISLLSLNAFASTDLSLEAPIGTFNCAFTIYDTLLNTVLLIQIVHLSAVPPTSIHAIGGPLVETTVAAVLGIRVG